MTKYGVFGWFDGAYECDPPEPGKHWLTIATFEDDGSMGEEIAIVVCRVPFAWDFEQMRREKPALVASKEADAKRIVDALNAWELRKSNRLHVVAIGNAFDGIALYGPFPDNESATRWAETYGDIEAWNVVSVAPIEGEQV